MVRFVKCGACQLTITEIVTRVMTAEVRKGGKKQAGDDVSMLMEEFCDSGIAEFGLQLDNNARPLPKFTADRAVNRARGGWLKRILVSICGEVVSDFEDALLKGASESCHRNETVIVCDPVPLSRMICLKELRLCKPGDFRTEMSRTEEESKAERGGPAGAAGAAGAAGGAGAGGVAGGSDRNTEQELLFEATASPITLTLPGFHRAKSLDVEHVTNTDHVTKPTAPANDAAASSVVSSEAGWEIEDDDDEEDEEVEKEGVKGYGPGGTEEKESAGRDKAERETDAQEKAHGEKEEQQERGDECAQIRQHSEQMREENALLRAQLKAHGVPLPEGVST
eukprot:2875091-Rhodomonas_salina.2